MYQLKDYLYSINQSKKNILVDDINAEKKYPAFVINRCLSSFTDTVLLAGYGVYKGFFANKDLADPWDDHDD